VLFALADPAERAALNLQLMFGIRTVSDRGLVQRRAMRGDA
jgi:hypothetical protein